MSALVLPLGSIRHTGVPHKGERERERKDGTDHDSRIKSGMANSRFMRGKCSALLLFHRVELSPRQRPALSPFPEPFSFQMRCDPLFHVHRCSCSLQIVSPSDRSPSHEMPMPYRDPRRCPGPWHCQVAAGSGRSPGGGSGQTQITGDVPIHVQY